MSAKNKRYWRLMVARLYIEFRKNRVVNRHRISAAVLYTVYDKYGNVIAVIFNKKWALRYVRSKWRFDMLQVNRKNEGLGAGINKHLLIMKHGGYARKV